MFLTSFKKASFIGTQNMSQIMLKPCKIIMEYHVQNILKTGIKATSFINQTTLYENMTSHPVIFPEYFTIIRGQFKTPLNILDGTFCENNQHI